MIKVDIYIHEKYRWTRFDKKYIQDLNEWYYFDFRENSFSLLVINYQPCWEMELEILIFLLIFL